MSTTTSQSLASICEQNDITCPDFKAAFSNVSAQSTQNNNTEHTFTFKGDLDLTSLSLAPGIMPVFLSMLGGQSTQPVTVTVVIKPDPKFTSVSFVFNPPKITPVPDVTLTNVSIEIDYAPASNSASVLVKWPFSFTAFSNDLTAQVNMMLSATEMEIGAILSSPNGQTLQLPMTPKGIHFQEVGLNGCVLFKPLDLFVIGIQTQFFIGQEVQNVKVDDDNLAFSFIMEGDLPIPQYISFYLASASLSELFTMFTNVSLNLDMPLTMTDVSCSWYNPELKESLVLPDGNKVYPGYSFEGVVDLLGWSFYGALSLNGAGIVISQGVSAKLCMDPLSFGSIFSLNGDGAGYSIKVDDNGDPVKTNKMPKSSQDFQSINNMLKNAKTKKLVNPGGAELSFSNQMGTEVGGKIDGTVKFLDLSGSIQGYIASNSIIFNLSFGASVEGINFVDNHINCNLNSSSLGAVFGFQPTPAWTIALPDDLINDLSSETGLGSISLGDNFKAGFNINADGTGTFKFSTIFPVINSEVDLSFELDASMTTLGAVLTNVLPYIESHIADILGNALSSPAAWAEAVMSKYIHLPPNVSNTLAYVLNKAQSMGLAGTDLSDLSKIISSVPLADALPLLHSFYGSLTAQDIGAIAGEAYNIADPTEFLKTIKGLGYNEVNNLIKAMDSATHGNIGEIAKAAESIMPKLPVPDAVVPCLNKLATLGTVKNALGIVDPNQIAPAFKSLELPANLAVGFIRNEFPAFAVPAVLNVVLSAAEYPADEISSAIDDAEKAWGDIKNSWDDVKHFLHL